MTPNPHRQAVSLLGSWPRRSAVIAALLTLAAPVMPDSASGLSGSKLRVTNIEPTAIEPTADFITDRHILDAERSSESPSSSASQPDTQILQPEPTSPLPWSPWWLLIPPTSVWLWWILSRQAVEHQATGYQATGQSAFQQPAFQQPVSITKSAAVAETTAPKADLLTSEPGSATAQPQEQLQPALKNGLKNEFQQSDSQNWVRLTPQSSGNLQIDWKISAARKLALRHQGGRKLMLRLYAAEEMTPSPFGAQPYQQYPCSEQAQRLTLSLAHPDRHFIADLGYVTPEGRWLSLVSSVPSGLNIAWIEPPQAVNRPAAPLVQGQSQQVSSQLQQAQQAQKQGGSQLATPFLVRAFNPGCNYFCGWTDAGPPTADRRFVFLSCFAEWTAAIPAAAPLNFRLM